MARFIVFSMKRKNEKILKTNVDGDKIQEQFFNEFIKKWTDRSTREN